MITRFKTRKTLIPALLAGALTLTASWTQAATTPVTDCPLRDKPFSVDSPLMDVLMSPAAKAVLDEAMPGMTAKMPPMMVGTKAPSLSAILSPRTMASMAQMPADKLEQMNQKLAKVPVTDADKVARCARYDNEVPTFELGTAETKVLVFRKINGFDHGPSVDAASNAVKALGEQLGWDVVITDKGGAFNPQTLAQFDLVVWNNNSGDVLTLSQRKAFEDYINKGGAYVGIHGAGGDFIYDWNWYADELLGARFIGHPSDPQFQNGKVVVEKHPDGIGEDVAPGWTMMEEWYSFQKSARANGATVVATLDEASYSPTGRGGQDLRMGEDHPIVWTRCVGKGRAFYTAIGHRPELYHLPENLTLLRDGLVWAAEKGQCKS